RAFGGAQVVPAGKPGRWTLVIDQDAVDGLDPALTVADPAADPPRRRIRHELVDDLVFLLHYSAEP
ncbi:MAG TPA: hypothetical protein VFS60_11770, partial [Thermoanaerobaculia bacterium]|nr:hypothetical protein [Thermoanaerobaculia bacterium]